MSPLFIALGIGIIAYVVFVIAVPKAVPKESDDYLRNALDRLADETRAADEARTEVLRDQLSDASPLVRSIFGTSVMRPLYQAGLEAGYQNELQQLLAIMGASFGVTLAACYVLGFGAIGILVAPVVAYLVPLSHCRRRVVKRNRKFIDHFPDALDMIVRSVRSGFPLSVALQMLADNTEEPVRSEFRQVADEIALGRNMAQALSRLAVRINEPDVRFFVVVLTVQQETGGNLGEIVSNLSSIIRKRKHIRHKIRALTSEGRATGFVLGSLPFVVFLALRASAPNYLDPLFYDPLGQQLFALAIGLLIGCFFIVRKMINMEV